MLRPAMLAELNPAAEYSAADRPHRLMVYVDDMRTGGVETLANIPAKAVFRIRRLTQSQATIRYGTEVASDVIVLTTYAGR